MTTPPGIRRQAPAVDDSPRPLRDVEVPSSLRGRAAATTWQDLSTRVARARRAPRPSRTNDALETAAASDRDAPTAAAYLLWAADNHALEGDWAEAVRTCARAVERAGESGELVTGVAVGLAARHRLAECAQAAGDLDAALRSRWALLDDDPDTEVAAQGLLLTGLAAQARGRLDDAGTCFEAIAAPSEGTDTTAGQFARRAMQRLLDDRLPRATSAAGCRALVEEALHTRDHDALDRLLSRSHFVVGVVGGHFRLQDETAREALLAELSAGPDHGRGRLYGGGGKRYAFTDGFTGALLAGTVGLVLARGPRGWEWVGLALTQPTDAWLDRQPTVTPESNQPLPFSILAPWPSGRSFKAGGLAGFSAKQAAVIAAGPLGVALAVGFARSDCGFGPRGFYYNSRLSDTHQGVDAFAIDFTRYARGVPYDNESGGDPVLATAAGVVGFTRTSVASGDSSAPNEVQVLHADPATGTNRFMSRYLHMAGPSLIGVSTGMAIPRGMRLGFMNDTGTSVLDHLHFSIHDQSLIAPGAPRGPSVRITPLDGTSLGDDDDGTCVRSSNVEVRPVPPDDAGFVGQRVPPTMEPAVPTTVSVTMRNTGDTTWTPGFRLESLHQGWTVTQVPIGATVAPGDPVTVEFDLVALAPGDFRFQWQMARPFVHRFGQSTPRVTVEVARDDGGGDPCPALRRDRAAATTRLGALQAQLRDASPAEKPFLVDQIQRVRAEISAIDLQLRRHGC